jgi:hypothetical protein
MQENIAARHLEHAKELKGSKDPSYFQIEPTIKWPPYFESYSEYKNKLDILISEHPPFGEWLINKRGFESIRCCCKNNSGLWDLDVDALKTRYIYETTIITNEYNAKRAFAEFHLTSNASEYAAEDEEYNKLLAKYEFEVNNPQIQKPKKSSKLVDFEKLVEMCISTSEL